MPKPAKLKVVEEASHTSPVDAVTLKEALWQTLQGIRDGSVTPSSGDAVASQAREILRTVRTQLAIFSQSGKAVSTEVIDFARPE